MAAKFVIIITINSGFRFREYWKWSTYESKEKFSRVGFKQCLFVRRYHQSQMDVQLLKAGSRFRDLKESYVIFICAFDPFGRGKYRYRFEEYCREGDLPRLKIDKDFLEEMKQKYSFLN